MQAFYGVLIFAVVTLLSYVALVFFTSLSQIIIVLLALGAGAIVEIFYHKKKAI
ncbi:MAG: hypothetical protein LRY73_10210 [Bacillus sp. (in: Bacteria)]|nr:hypothetical protein [Bacillus sp. (in: firmicutes)]